MILLVFCALHTLLHLPSPVEYYLNLIGVLAVIITALLQTIYSSAEGHGQFSEVSGSLQIYVGKQIVV